MIQPGTRFRNTSVTAVAGTPEIVDESAVRARGNIIWVGGSLVVFAGWIALAHAVPATNANQFKVKSWLAIVAIIGSVVQLATISRVYDWTKRIPPGGVATLGAIHRWSGRITLAVGGAVMYMCMTGQFASGFSTHRLVGYSLAAVVVTKVVILRANRFGALLPYLGMLAVAGWVTCFLTKGFSVIF